MTLQEAYELIESIDCVDCPEIEEAYRIALECIKKVMEDEKE